MKFVKVVGDLFVFMFCGVCVLVIVGFMQIVM